MSMTIKSISRAALVDLLDQYQQDVRENPGEFGDLAAILTTENCGENIVAHLEQIAERQNS